MATKKTNGKEEPKSRAKTILHRGGIAALKATASGAIGATVGIVEVELGESAAKGVTAAAALGGLATEIFVDPEENPALSELGKAGLHTATGITSYKGSKSWAEQNKSARLEKNHDQAIAKLKADMEAPAAIAKNGKVNGQLEAPRDMVPVAKKRRTAKAKTKAAEG